MVLNGENFGKYRVLNVISSLPAGALYLVDYLEDSSQYSFLLFLSDLSLSSDEERASYLQRARGGLLIHNGQSLLIRDAHLQGNIPYLVFDCSESGQKFLLGYLQTFNAQTQRPELAEHAALFPVWLQSIVPNGTDEPTRVAPALADEPTRVAPALADEPTRVAPALADESTSQGFDAPTQIVRPAEAQASEPTVAAWQAPFVPAPFASPSSEGSNVRAPFEPQSNRASGTGFVTPPVKRGWKPTSWQKAVLIVLLLLILLGSGWAAYTFIPAGNATVNLTSVQINWERDYTLTVAPAFSTADPLSVAGRALDADSQQHTVTVNATGHATHPATRAKGNIILSQVHLDSTAPNQVLEPSSVTNYNGVSVTTDNTVPLSEGATITIPAHATDAGSGGNIGANTINEDIEIIDNLTQVHVGTGHITNPDSFTGGAEPRDYTFVQQSDIDQATNTVIGQGTAEATDMVKKQAQPEEHFIKDPDCAKPQATADHQANDEAGNVTVSAKVSCNGLVYTDKAIRDVAVRDFQNDGKQKWGKLYNVVGDVVTDPATQSSSDPTSFTIHAKGVLAALYLTKKEQNDLKSLIAGRSHDQAVDLLKGRKEIKGVSITTGGGLTTAIPQNLDNIKLVLSPVTGLHMGN
ncbi:hypothetical protein [Tengunoibacter tsumagoiensis]|uniref:Baseplate protein J-like barrel domain-containing protein n=1 Tax=Tengunoibacter tsumagoiensis TaxID=2014871 RepID=A0A401ZW57_9CHLR|nr:hypothetical protein [Tengunoibacter tsumagoiensis]GCE11123.1 hypothetical protein KTT_09820 [Tengunoibacter tsumagoiensis]